MHNKWKPLVPTKFNIPYSYKTSKFLIKKLGINDIIEDYEAVMSSVNRLKNTFDFYPEWPDSKMTLEEDLSNLGWHQTEFELRTSFAYSVRTVKNNRYIGCIY